SLDPSCKGQFDQLSVLQPPAGIDGRYKDPVGWNERKGLAGVPQSRVVPGGGCIVVIADHFPDDVFSAKLQQLTGIKRCLIVGLQGDLLVVASIAVSHLT